jgi:hypothetical protein
MANESGVAIQAAVGEPDDTDLVAAVLASDSAAFGLLYRRHEGAAKRLAPGTGDAVVRYG